MVPLVVIIVLFDFFQIRDHYLDYKDSSRLNKAIIVGIEINHIVHEIQKERSMSVGFLSHDGFSFNVDLSKQRVKTDSAIAELLKEMDRSDLKSLIEVHGDDLRFLTSVFSRLKDIRSGVDRLGLTTEEARKSYSEINSVALLTVNKLIDETRDRHVAQQVHAIIYFLKAKEAASIERAIGTRAFSHNHIDFHLYNEFTSLVSSQESYLDAFNTIADFDSEEFYLNTVKGNAIDEVNRLRAVIFANEDLSQNPQHWYEVSTAKINAMKQVEDFLLDHIHDVTESIAATAVQRFWIFLIVDLLIGVSTFWLMTILVRNLLVNVSTLEEFTKKVSSGDLSDRVHIDTKDELGHYARTFNVMVDEINISHNLLKKERDRARFMYKNIYQVALEVFGNIHQGIFLLDKNFRISKLYSKATEHIFGTTNVAGEHFSSFMRPLILPRELEALEMFMRHLFNPEMDEEVVNMLNPVEQVKIYTESKGVIASKYIRISFTRIVRKGEIRNVMVTVSDETEAILLHQHIEEAEKKRKQETEQVLSILKIDPAIMRGFIFNSRKQLRQISQEYEKSEGSDHARLLDFTFKTIHNIKGNATVIGLELMSNKFHSIEDAIVKLRGKTVQGKDFLMILYEIDESDKMLQDMAEMLQKVANIYKKYASEGQAVSNILVIDTLEKGIELISKEVGKEVDFKFLNEKNIILPDRYISPFKDVMIQLIRNSISHGIEDSKTRVERGKDKKGRITITMDKPGDQELLITYQDDGAGLDLNKIKAKALADGVITEYEATKLKKSDIANLIFKEGFSISDKADHLSGRGQGMGLVTSILEELEGSIKIEFEEDSFFRVVLSLPMMEEDHKEEVL